MPRANPFGVLRGFVSAYSQNEIAGTTQRLCWPSQPRQCGLLTLRILVTGAAPNWGGPGIPQRAMTSSPWPSAPLRTIGAIWSGKMLGNSGRLPVRSCRHAPPRWLAFAAKDAEDRKLARREGPTRS